MYASRRSAMKFSFSFRPSLRVKPACPPFRELIILLFWFFTPPCVWAIIIQVTPVVTVIKVRFGRKFSRENGRVRHVQHAYRGGGTGGTR